MNILSQDKEEIINCNNVNYIGRNKNMIYVDFPADNFRIGVYKTEERAKEVFDDIISHLGVKVGKGVTGTYEEIDLKIKGQKILRYEMPKE